MPEIYHHSHPYYSPGKDNCNPSLMHQIIFGNNLDESFPHTVCIPTKHRSQWRWYDSSYLNEREETGIFDAVELGNFLRKFLVNDVFITQQEIEYRFDTKGDNDGDYYGDNKHQNYYKRDEKGFLYRLPANCRISFTTIRFRDEVDKTQFLLLHAGNINIEEQILSDFKTKHHRSSSSYRDEGNDLMCPFCKVHYNG
jgi:hypothetical protein